MTNGEVYLLPLNETELDFMNIQTLELTSVVNANYTGASVSTIGRSIDDTQIVCFTKGTPIATIHGQVDVSDLKIGDKVMTMDNGYQPICWVGKKRVQAIGHLAPVTIARGALGPNIPEHALCVSQQHRILLRSTIAIRMLDTSEILVPAKKLVGQAGISIEDHREVVEYVHFLLPQHEIVFAADAPAESLYLGQEMLGTVGDDARKEIFSLFPELMHPAFQPQGARQFAPGSTIPGRALKNMLRRIKGNQKALVERMSLSAL